MNKRLQIAALAGGGLLLLVVSSLTTSYDRGDIATFEVVLAIFLLLVAVVMALAKMDKPGPAAPLARRNEPDRKD